MSLAAVRSTLGVVTPNGAAIRTIREARGLSLRRLAHLIDVHPSFLSRIETGKRGCSQDVINQIAKALDLNDPEAITKGDAP